MFSQPHDIPEEYKRKAERNSSTNQPVCIKKEEKCDTKKILKNQTLLNSRVKLDDSLKNDVKLKAEVKVNMNKDSHETRKSQQEETLADALWIKQEKVS